MQQDSLQYCTVHGVPTYNRLNYQIQNNITYVIVIACVSIYNSLWEIKILSKSYRSSETQGFLNR